MGTPPLDTGLVFWHITSLHVVDVVQLVERQIVGLVVAGSSPVIHPACARSSAWIERRTSNPQVAGSNPAGRTWTVGTQHGALQIERAVSSVGRAADS